MEQTDWVGDARKAKVAKDIRDQRDAVAAEKARLCLRITELCRTIPPKLKTGGFVHEVRQWKEAREKCLKVSANKRSSVHELEAAMNIMARWGE